MSNNKNQNSNKNNNRNNYKNNNYNKKNQDKQTGTKRTVEAEQVKKQNVENTKEVEKETVAEPKAAEVKAQPEKINKTAQTENRIDVNELKDKLTNVLNRKNTRIVLVSAAKIVLPVIALIIVIATIISLVHSKNGKDTEVAASLSEETTEGTVSSAVLNEPLEENKYPAVNELVQSFYTALAEGDMDTVKALKDYTNDKEIITYQKKSEYIESYNNLTCYTKDGIDPNTYYLYVCYDVKFKDIDTMAPGLNAWYVYTNDAGSLQIDGDMEESVTAALKLVTSQDDVVDLYNKVDVEYKEAIADDEQLNTFLAEFPNEIKTSVGVALAQLEQESQEETQQQTTETAQETTTETAATEEQPQTQTVNQQVRVTDTVNVRSSDSEVADKIGKAQQGDILTRTEEKNNGWSKVIYEGKEAYIKSDYLEVVSDNTDTAAATTETVVKTVKAKTNVNVRNAASEDADKIGVAQGEATFNVLEDQGEWLKIEYNGQTGYVKAEFFE